MSTGARREVGLLRLVALGLAGPRAATATEAVRRLGCVQAQDAPGALTSVALRTVDGTRDDVRAAMDAGEVVRSWPMRGTVHLTAAEDLPWLLELLAARPLAGAARRREFLGIGDDEAERACELAGAAVAGGRRLTRAELLAALDEGGVPTTGQRGYHLIWFAAQTGVVCQGPTDASGEQCWVALPEWVPATRRFAERDEALGELARRYFTSHGPATVEDLARWAGCPKGWARTGVALAREDIDALVVDGTEYLLDPATPERLAACRDDARALRLLPGFDEFVLGYGDRDAIIDPAFAERLVPGRNGVFRPTVVRDGRIVGTWRAVGSGARRRVETTPFTSFPKTAERAIERAWGHLP